MPSQQKSIWSPAVHAKSLAIAIRLGNVTSWPKFRLVFLPPSEGGHNWHCFFPTPARWDNRCLCFAHQTQSERSNYSLCFALSFSLRQRGEVILFALFSNTSQRGAIILFALFYSICRGGQLYSLLCSTASAEGAIILFAL
jgi:hypothetical protein